MDKTASRLYTIFFGLVILFVSSIYQIPGGIRINLLLYPQIGIYAVLGFFHAFNMMRFKSWNNTCRLQMLGDGNSENKNGNSAFEALDLISDWLLYTAWYNVILFPLSGFGVIEWVGVFVVLVCGFISDLSGTTYPLNSNLPAAAYVPATVPATVNTTTQNIPAAPVANSSYPESAVTNYASASYAQNKASSSTLQSNGNSQDPGTGSVNTATLYAENGEPILQEFIPAEPALPAIQNNTVPSLSPENQPALYTNSQDSSWQTKKQQLNFLRTAWFLGQSPMMLLITGAALYIFKVAVFYLLPANLYLEAFHGNSLARTMIVLFCLLGIIALASLLKKNIQASLSKETQEKIVETSKKAGNAFVNGVKKIISKLGKILSAKAFFLILLIAGFAAVLIAGIFALNIYNKILEFVEPFMEQLLKNGKTVIIPSKLYGICQTFSLIAILFSATLTAHNVTKNNIKS